VGKEKQGMTTMTTRHSLTAKFCDHISKQGEYLDHGGPVPGLIFIVGPNGRSKSWLLRYRYRGKRREMGLRSYPEISLAEARAKGGEARKLLANNIDPIEHRREQENQQRQADIASKTYKEVAYAWLATKQLGPKDERWRDNSIKSTTRMIERHLKLLHDKYPREIDEVYFFETIIKPMMDTAPAALEYTRWVAEKIFAFARHPLKIFPLDRLNPASKEALEPMMGTWRHQAKPLPALHFDKIPPFMAAVRQYRERRWYSLRELARATQKNYYTIHSAVVEGRIKATKTENAFPTSVRHWQIAGEDAFMVYPKKVDLPLPPQTIASFIVEFAVLTGTRPSETRMMRKSEYDPIERLWTIPWQRHKVGRRTRRDHIIPLAPEAVDIINTVLEHQRRDGLIESDYMFTHFSVRNTLAKPGAPCTDECVRKFLKKMLFQVFGETEVDKVMHAFRTTLRSWGEAQRRDGLRLYDDKVLERAINHIEGYGKDNVVRIYNRLVPFVAEMVPLFEHYASYCYTTPDPTKVVPFRKRAKQSEGGKSNARIRRQQDGS
jgi:integrase